MQDSAQQYYRIKNNPGLFAFPCRKLRLKVFGCIWSDNVAELFFIQLVNRIAPNACNGEKRALTKFYTYGVMSKIRNPYGSVNANYDWMERTFGTWIDPITKKRCRLNSKVIRPNQLAKTLIDQGPYTPGVESRHYDFHASMVWELAVELCRDQINLVRDRAMKKGLLRGLAKIQSDFLNSDDGLHYMNCLSSCAQRWVKDGERIVYKTGTTGMEFHPLQNLPRAVRDCVFSDHVETDVTKCHPTILLGFAIESNRDTDLMRGYVNGSLAKDTASVLNIPERFVKSYVNAGIYGSQFGTMPLLFSEWGTDLVNEIGYERAVAVQKALSLGQINQLVKQFRNLVRASNHSYECTGKDTTRKLVELTHSRMVKWVKTVVRLCEKQRIRVRLTVHDAIISTKRIPNWLIHRANEETNVFLTVKERWL